MSGKSTSPTPDDATDWDRIAALTDDDIRKAVAEDPDAVLIEDVRGQWRVKTPAPEVDVRAVRERTGLSQAAFADRYGFSKRAVQNWEQGRRKPDRAARILLWLISENSRDIDVALDVLRERAKA